MPDPSPPLSTALGERALREPLLSVTGLTVRYGAIDALTGVELSVGVGEDSVGRGAADAVHLSRADVAADAAAARRAVAGAGAAGDAGHLSDSARGESAGREHPPRRAERASGAGVVPLGVRAGDWRDG